MSSVDQRVVELQFNAGAFAKGIADTLASLTKLQDGLKLSGASQGADEAGAGLDTLGEKTGGVGSKFTAMQALALGALASIGAKAVSIGEQVVSSLTIDPIKAGLQEYATNMDSIQTILANTQVSGATLGDVNSALNQLNTYSDQTIYNFSEMAKNIGTFTAAGVGLDQSVQSIKGIANLAALSGSNSEQASTAMYQLSQAISSGKVSLQDWNSVVNAGMGGTVFQRALAQTAENMGTLGKGTVQLSGDMQNVTIAGQSFRDSIDATNGPSWLTSDVLTSTLSQFTGDLSDAQLAAQGFSAAQITAIQAQAKTAQQAATQVKTLGQVFDVAKESAGSGWTSTFQIIFGDFDEAKGTFTDLSNFINGFINNSSKARNNLLQGWKDLGGRTVLIDNFKLAFDDLMSVLRPVKDAFREIFPATTSKNLYDMTVAIHKFLEPLILTGTTADNFKRTMAGLFAVLGIGWDLIKAGAGFIGDLVGSFSLGSKGGGILSFTAKIGDFLVALHNAIESGDAFGKIFAGLAAVIKVPIQALQELIGWVVSFFDKTSSFDSGKAWSNITQPVSEAGDRIGGIFQRMASVLDTVKDKVGSFVSTVVAWFGKLGDVFKGNGWSFNADTIMKALGIGTGVGLAALLIKSLNGIKKALAHFDLFGGAGGGVFDTLKESLEQVTGTLKSMQENLKATALLKIAAAIGVLAVSVLILSGIPAEGLLRATGALTVMFVQLGVMMKLMSKVGGTGSAIKMGILSAGLILLATAVLILSFAVKELSSLSWEELAKGLIGVTVLLGALAGAAKLMNGQTGDMVKTGAMLLLLAVAIKILVSAVKDLADIGWADLAKGLVGVGALLGALALFTKFADADKGGISQGAGLLLLAAALKVLASAVGDFASYSWEELGKGMAAIAVGLGLITAAMNLLPEGSLLKAAGVLIIAASLKLIADAVAQFSQLSWAEIARGMTSMAAALGAIAIALKLIPASSVLSAAAVLLVAASLGMISNALQDMATMSWEELAKGLVGLAAALGIIAIALNVMDGALPGAAAVLVVAGALAVLYPIIKGFSDMSWEELAKGMAALAAVFLILGVAGLLLAPLTPVLLAIGAAIFLLGAGVILAAAGVLVFSIALTALAAAGAAGAAALGAIVTTLLGLLPLAASMLAAAIVAFAVAIGEGAPAIIEAFTKIMIALLQAVIDITPKIADTVLALLLAMLQVITQAVPALVQAGITILLAFLQGIADNIGKVGDTAVDIIVNFIDGIARNLGRIIQSGVNLVVQFMQGLGSAVPQVVDAAFQMVIAILNGIADSISQNTQAIIDAGGRIVAGLIDGIVQGIKDLAGQAINAVKGLASDMWDGAMNFLHIGGPSKLFQDTVGAGIPLGIAAGIDDKSGVAIDSTVAMGQDMLSTMGKTISGLGDLVGGMDDFNPVITPVLDLSSVQKGSAQIGDLLATSPIDLSDAMSNVSDASAGYAANLEAIGAQVAATSGTNLTFNQTNNSPKALSQADIYRQTNNQISQAKGVLTNAN